ncbi:MAG: KilA-N domain-containing protein [Clostridium sp.]|uniref:KilA-N domain-containing protein n=1 Tax=Clostridium sp. TaxID=1506 RepID=UPI003EE480C3
MNNLVVKKYLGNSIEFKMIDGMVYANANSMARNFGGSSKIADWKRSSNTKRYLEAMENSHRVVGELIISKDGIEAGTWIHEKLVLHLARYCDISFEIWCDEQITTLIREGKVEIQSQPTRIEEVNLKYAVLSNISNLMNLNDSSKASLSNKIVKTMNLGDELLLDYVDSKGVLFPPSDLLKKNNKELKIITFNKLLLADGILEEKERNSSKGGVKKYKALSTKGLEYGENQVSPMNPKEVQPMYYENKFLELYDLIVNK